MSVPKSMSRLVTVVAAANDPMAWSSTPIVTFCVKVGADACGLVAVTVMLPACDPGLDVFTDRAWVFAGPRARSEPVPVTARMPVPVKP